VRNEEKQTDNALELFRWLDSHGGRGPSTMTADRHERYLSGWVSYRRTCRCKRPDDPLVAHIDEMAAAAGYPKFFYRLRHNGTQVRIISADIKNRDERAAKMAAMACEFCDRHMRVPDQNSSRLRERLIGRWIQNAKAMFRRDTANPAGLTVLKNNNKMWLVNGPVRRRSHNKMRFIDMVASM